MQKYGFDEARPILERASARETAARVALGPGAPATSSSRPSAPGSSSHVVELGGVARARRLVVPTPDDVARLDDDPVRCLDPDAQQADGRRDRPGPQGRRHPRRRRRGRRARPAAGPRLARALGPPPRLAARRRADGHPGDQGRRGRRRVRARGHPGLAGPRRDRHRPTTASAARQRPLRRHRGRHDHRRDAAGPRRDEADRDRARGRCAPSTSPPARRPSPTTSAPTSARSRPPASSPRRWSRWCWPRRSLEKFGGDSVARDPRATPRATSTR